MMHKFIASSHYQIKEIPCKIEILFDDETSGRTKLVREELNTSYEYARKAGQVSRLERDRSCVIPRQSRGLVSGKKE